MIEPLQQNLPEGNTRLKNLFLILIFTFIASGGVLIVLYVTQNYYRNQLYLETEGSLPVHRVKPKSDSPSTPLGTVDDIANWKTYRNEEYGFEFKYPADWKTFTVDNYSESRDFLVGFRPPVKPENYNEGPYISLFYNHNPLNLALSTYFENQSNNYEDIRYLPFLDVPPTEVKDINGINFHTFLLPGVITTRHTYFSKKLGIFEFYKPEDLSYTEYYSDIELVGIYSDIISTFKFIE